MSAEIRWLRILLIPAGVRISALAPTKVSMRSENSMNLKPIGRSNSTSKSTSLSVVFVPFAYEPNIPILRTPYSIFSCWRFAFSIFSRISLFMFSIPSQRKFFETPRELLLWWHSFGLFIGNSDTILEILFAIERPYYFFACGGTVTFCLLSFKQRHYAICFAPYQINTIEKPALSHPMTIHSCKLKSILLKLDPGLLEKIKVIAHKRGLSYNAMMRYLLSKGIEKEIREG